MLLNDRLALWGVHSGEAGAKKSGGVLTHNENGVYGCHSKLSKKKRFDRLELNR
jgi:hypothetical protein